jgi:exopolysaccharide biosynthesis polyprenyl glycosylphosphotransferase
VHDRAGQVWVAPSTRTWRHALLRRLLACADLGAALLATVAVPLLTAANSGDVAWSLVFLPAWIVIAKLLGLYDRDEAVLRHLTVDEIPQLVLWSFVSTLALSLFLQVTPAGGLPASTAIAATVAAAIGVVVLRGLARWSWRVVTPVERVGLVGPAPYVDLFKRKVELFPDLHMAVVVERSPDEVTSDGEWIQTIDRLVFAPSSLDGDDIDQMFRLSRAHGVLMTVIPPREHLFAHSVRISRLAELPVLDYGKLDLPGSTLFLKRALDVGLASITLVVLAPILAAIALAVKLDSPAPVFFSQLRAGQGGRPFRIHKFRTMVENAEELLPRLVRIDELPAPVFKLEEDPRVTRIGRLLRRWSLDELPQLWNVLKGEMSLVGPRPEEVMLVKRYSPEQRQRLLVKPGMTGPMQVYGRGALDLDERVAVERHYIENLTFGRDVKILGMTLAAVIRGEGAL